MPIPNLTDDGEEGQIDVVYVTASSYTPSDGTQPNTLFTATYGELKGAISEIKFNYPDDEENTVSETSKNGYLTLNNRTRVLNDDELPAGNTGGGGPTTTQIWRTG